MMAQAVHNSLIQRYLPVFAGLLFMALFVRLGIWQLDRAEEKAALAAAFDNPANMARVSEGLAPETYQAIGAKGSYLAGRQVLIDNVVRNGRVGYYVITPFEFSTDAPLLLVNRGWVIKDPSQSTLPDLSVDTTTLNISGKAGRLPRVGIRPGEAFADRISWPRIGVWPTSLEIAAEVGRDVLPYVLLLDPQQAPGFERQWKPPDTGTSTHYGYAFQWFAMAATVAGLMAWHFRRRRGNDDN